MGPTDQDCADQPWRMPLGQITPLPLKLPTMFLEWWSWTWTAGVGAGAVRSGFGCLRFCLSIRAWPFLVISL